MKISNQIMLSGMLLALPAAAADVDTSKWKCESCKFETGVSGTLDVGVGSVSDKSAEFGQYNGLHKQGGFFIGDAALRSRGADGAYWNLDASDLGLDTRALNAEGGKQGTYKLRLKYDEAPHRIWDGALADLSTQRNQLGVGASWNRTSLWEYAVNFRHETRDGNILRTGGAFFVNTQQLVEPVDYVTDQVDASASYSGRKFQLKLAYYGSKFSNGRESLTWLDPYAPVNFETRGELALPPDNQFHQVSASAGYRFSERTRASADIAFGRMTQNDNFFAPTLNTLAPGLLQPLPGASLNARANTLNANLKLSSAVTDRLRLQAVYAHNDRDNRTPQAAYPVVSTDMFGPTYRTNLPYGFKQDKLKLSADYRVSAKLRGSLGADFDAHERTYQEIEKTRENTAWGKLSSRLTDKLDVTLKLAHGERRKDGSIQWNPLISPAENPLLRRFEMANRTRETMGLRADFAVAENVNLGLGFDSSEDKYKDSAIGLTNGKDRNLNGDLSMLVTARARLHFFANRQEIKSAQAGSQGFSVPDWNADTKDTINTFGLGLKYAAIPDKLDVGADYGITRARSEIRVNTGASNPEFPGITTRLNSLKLYATYKMKENLSLLAGYWHERYDSKNWMLDGVTPTTIPGVLTLGLQAPQYNVNVLRMSLRYKF